MTTLRKVSASRGIPSSVVLPAIAAAVLTFVIVLMETAELRGAQYQEWVVVSAQARESLMFVAPVVAGTTAAAVARLYLPRSLLTLGTGHRSGVQQALAPILAVSLASAISYVLALLPLFYQAVVTATDGHLHVGPAVTALVFIVGIAFTGGLFGVVLPRLPAIITSVAVGFVATNLVAWLGDGWWAVGPVLFQAPQPGQIESIYVQGYRLFFAIVVAAGVGVIIHFATSRTAPRSGLPLSITALAIFLIAGAAWPINAQPALYTFENQPRALCATTTEGSQVCVHAAHERDLNSAVASIEAVEARYPVDIAAVVPPHLLDQSLAYQLPLSELSDLLVIRIAPGQGGSMGYTLAQELSGIFRCPVGVDQTPQSLLSGDIGLWLSGQSSQASAVRPPDGAGTPDGPSISVPDPAETGGFTLSELSDEQIGRALGATFGEVSTCTMQYSDFISLALQDLS